MASHPAVSVLLHATTADTVREEVIVVTSPTFASQACARVIVRPVPLLRMAEVVASGTRAVGRNEARALARQLLAHEGEA